MRNRLTVTEKITDHIYVSQSVYPRFGRPNKVGLLLAFFAGAALFVIGCLIFIAIFAP